MQLDNSHLVASILDPEQLLVKREWQQLRPGVRISFLYNTPDNGPSAAFLHYAVGASVPPHVHADFEHILILHGSQHDGTALHEKGALLISKPGSEHQIKSEAGCIALAIWVKPVVFV
ncbi:MAG: cupin domain-containing protein [Pseudomonadota bacterium]